MRFPAKRVMMAVAAPFVVLLWGGCPADPLSAEKEGESSSALRIEAITPEHGPATGGTRVTIRGGPFEDQIGVLFGAHAAVDPIRVNTRMITAIAPPQAPGIVNVTVLSNGGETTFLGAFTYDASVVRVDSVEPASGPIEGGTQVTLRGALIPVDAAVLFGDTSASEVTFINEQIVTVTAPAGSVGVVDVTLVYAGGQVVVPDAFRFSNGPIPDDGTDTDNDGLTDVQEITGWQVWIDSFAQASSGRDSFLNVYKYAVTSDPNNPDTDGDGLPDKIEFLIKSDPRKFDSDNDGLWDGEEWNQWLTSPTSVDTDGDARGGSDPGDQLAPNQSLFDGLELFTADALLFPPHPVARIVRPLATSPTLADTDGDGVSDADEFDSTVRNGVLADLPRLEYELVGDVDVRLRIEYAESEAESVERGVTLTKSKTDTVASSYSSTIGFSVQVAVKNEFKASLFEIGSTSSVEVTAGIHGEFTFTTSNESSRTASEEKSRVTSKSKEFTETAAEGSIRTAVLLRNSGNTTFTLDGLSVLVSQLERLKKPGDKSPGRPRKTIATMTPVFDSITLAPGETAGPFELAATGVNADAIKELLAAPDSLLLGTAAINFTDSSGLDFDFVRQFTVAQTATIVIDFGDNGKDTDGKDYGDDGGVRTYVVATNVDRNPDSSYRGITLRRALEEVLQLPFGDPIDGYTTMTSRNSGLETLESLLGREYVEGKEGQELRWWTVMTSNTDHVDFDFTDVVLHAGDSLHLMFERDDDGDGLSNTAEKFAGTDQHPLKPGDADDDGLSDVEEVIDGWIAFEDPDNPDDPHPQKFEKFQVFSSPTSADTDGDGLTDLKEKEWRSDPHDPDTDGDGLIDGQDPFPIFRAGIRFVQAGASGVDGDSWADAYGTIQQALEDAIDGQKTPDDPEDDVAQIWVARGTYKPLDRLSPITLLNNLRIYGGFSGKGANFAGETKRGQRNTNAFTNGCVITGDLVGDDIGDIDLDDPRLGKRGENSPVVVAAGEDIDSSALLDGFMITGAYAYDTEPGGALFLLGSPTIQNCLFTRNGNQRGGAGVRVAGSGSPLFKKCIMANNVANYGGGAFVTSTGQIVFEDCEFAQNEARPRRITEDDPRSVGGGAFVQNAGRVDFNRCAFTGNQAYMQGGGLYALGDSTYVRVDSCRFYSNAVTTTGGLWDWRGCGGGFAVDADASVSNSTFWDNRAKQLGGAISVISGAGRPGEGYWNGPIRRCTITNCTIVNNRAWGAGGNTSGGGIASAGRKSNVLVQNTISWANWYGVDELPDDPNYEEHHQIYDWDGQSTWSVENTCLNAGRPNRWRGKNGNINDDPELLGVDLGDLRLGEESPCIDRGNTFVDLDPLLPGFQQLPEFDFFGNPRIADGNSDGIVAVDIGASEVKPRD